MSKEPEPEGKADESKDPETDPNDLSPADVKIILLGDSAVGKTKLVERFLMDFPERRVNGEPVIDLYDPNDPGKGGRPQQPRIVEVPQL